uniref:SFRICE_017266 n=1 Tax=Spodoptera frugiperda TaxID=7108 RepID=A0A2H1WSI2_SPOFR
MLQFARYECGAFRDVLTRRHPRTRHPTPARSAATLLTPRFPTLTTQPVYQLSANNAPSLRATGASFPPGAARGVQIDKHNIVSAGRARGRGMQGARVAGGARLALTRLSVVAHNGGVRAPQEVNDSIACSQKALNETHNPALSNITTVVWPRARLVASDGGQPMMEAMEYIHKQPSQLNLEHNLKTSSRRSIYHKVHISVGVAFTSSENGQATSKD